MKRVLSVMVAVLFAAALGACSTAKAPAEQAIKAAEEALNASKAEAMKYIPDQVKSVEDALKVAKDSFAKGVRSAVMILRFRSTAIVWVRGDWRPRRGEQQSGVPAPHLLPRRPAEEPRRKNHPSRTEG